MGKYEGRILLFWINLKKNFFKFKIGEWSREEEILK